MIDKINVMLDKGAIMPTRAHEADAGFDLYTPYDFELSASDDVSIDTGVHIEIPKGYVGFLKSKSGLNVKDGIKSEGVIDSGYTGSIVVKLYRNDVSGIRSTINKSSILLGGNRVVMETRKFKKGDKISQLVILPIETPELVLVDKFKETDRGDNGFGSTGK